MKALSDGWKHGWKMIRHILRQDQSHNCNITMTWAQKKKEEDQRLPEGTQLRKKEKSKVRTIAAEQERWKRSGYDLISHTYHLSTKPLCMFTLPL